MRFNAAAVALAALALALSGCLGRAARDETPNESAFEPLYATLSESAAPCGSGFGEFARELLDNRGGELTERLDEWLSSHRDGTFDGALNHHDPYPDDFPPAENLPKAADIDGIAVAWRETEERGENTESPGTICVIVPIDSSHICVLEPVLFSASDGESYLGFANSGFDTMDVAVYVQENRLQYEILKI